MRKLLIVAAMLTYAAAMEEPAAASPSPAAASFAGLLAALTAPAQKARPAFDEDDFADDLATLSYEQALRTHARYRPTAAAPPPRPGIDDAAPDPRPASTTKLSLEECRKSASITIRLSRAESVQLHARAAEAGLSVSAYLRSCTLEVEALRAQVKEALAQLRPATATNVEATSVPAPPSPPTWRSRLFPSWISHRRTGRA